MAGDRLARRAGAPCAAVVAAALCAGTAAAQDDGAAPLSAIEWLSRSLVEPVAQQRPPAADLSDGAAPSPVSVAPLDGTDPDAAGILPSSVTGLPATLWGTTPVETLSALIASERVEAVPALQDLLYTLLLAELDPPHDTGATEGTLFLARVDKLMALGALEQAQALLDLAGASTPGTFRRAFDTALLLGEEDRACETLRAQPGIAPSFQARVFCLARGGDWAAAALSLETGEALGYVTGAEADLMARFLDPGIADTSPPLPPPFPMTPLTWRMLEAIGEPVPTATLPVAFAHADLRGTSGWKARIEAAERLARLGAIPANRLLGTYTEGRAAASGGVWDRVAAVRAFDAALAGGDPDAIAPALAEVWPQMSAQHLEVPLAELYGRRLQAMDLNDDAAALAFRIGLLSADYEEIAAAAPDDSAETAQLADLARGQPGTPASGSGMAAAVAAGFADDRLPAALGDIVADGRLGEALLRSMARLANGAAGDLRPVTEGLALLRHLGLEDTARRTALQLMILDRRG